ncbi:hypothetical protein [Pseudomonas aegrilactucae]|uniref:Uncharacterized protein n=1 Tax=Pseudomonas aegrilactucae TaxID=2854028 RepID=A0A9Q3AE35_9PSED|nr:hypothetical protein [Pseudomonas aegrilactucae]MBV6287628.1 hypothetical protein [Pseudomonas aegrilactucae]
MDSTLLTANAVFTYTSASALSAQELEVLSVFLCGVSKIEKTAAPIFSQLSSGLPAEMAWAFSYSFALESCFTGGDASTIPQQRYLPDCSGVQSIFSSDNIYEKAREVVDRLALDFAGEQLTQINDYANMEVVANSLTDILESWEGNWLAPVQGVKLFSMGPSGRRLISSYTNGTWSSQVSTALTLFSFQSGITIRALDVFRPLQLEGIIELSYRTVEFLSPVLEFGWYGQTPSALSYMDNFKQAFDCDPGQEVTSAPLG